MFTKSLAPAPEISGIASDWSFDWHTCKHNPIESVFKFSQKIKSGVDKTQSFSFGADLFILYLSLQGRHRTISMRLQTGLLPIIGSALLDCEAASDEPSEGHIEAVLSSVYRYAFYDVASDDNGETINDKGRGSFALDVQDEFAPGRLVAGFRHAAEPVLLSGHERMLATTSTLLVIGRCNS